jgi:hypothetical protein
MMARSSDPQKVAAWRERFVRFEASELGTADFFAAEGVSSASFYAWRRKLGLSQTRVAKNDPRVSREPGEGVFQQVLIHTAPALAVRLPGGVQLEASGVDEQALRTIVGELVRATREVETSSC